MKKTALIAAAVPILLAQFAFVSAETAAPASDNSDIIGLGLGVAAVIIVFVFIAYAGYRIVKKWSRFSAD